MTKFWIVYSPINSGEFKRHDTYQSAEDDAKRQASLSVRNEFIILEAIASTKQPVPPIDIVKL